MNKVEITGSPISWIQRKLLSADILSDDMFLVSTPELTSVSIDRTYEFNDEKYTARYASEYITYAQLSDAIFRDIYGYLDICSMVSAESGDYALLDHIHNYSKVSSRTDLAPDYYERFDTTGLCDIMTFTIDGWSKHFYGKPAITYQQVDPVIGQLRFMGLNTIPEKPNTTEFYSSQTFDGWVYPDGRILNQIDFPDAYSFFGTAYGTNGDGTFKIPLLNNFFKARSNLGDSISYVNPVNCKNVLKSHTHSMNDMNINGTVNYQLSYENNKFFNACDTTYATKTEYNKNYGNFSTDWNTLGSVAHAVKGKCESYLHVQISARFSTIPEITITDSSTDDTETYPSHELLPVFIYIGKYKGGAS